MSWTVDTLKEYVDAQFLLRQHEAEALAALLAVQTETSRQDMERRLEAMNALREQVNQERRTYVQRSEYDARHDELEKRWESLDRWRANIVGKVIGVSIVGALFTATVAAWVTHLLTS